MAWIVGARYIARHIACHIIIVGARYIARHIASHIIIGLRSAVCSERKKQKAGLNRETMVQ